MYMLYAESIKVQTKVHYFAPFSLAKFPPPPPALYIPPLTYPRHSKGPLRTPASCHSHLLLPEHSHVATLSFSADVGLLEVHILVHKSPIAPSRFYSSSSSVLSRPYIPLASSTTRFLLMATELQSYAGLQTKPPCLWQSPPYFYMWVTYSLPYRWSHCGAE